MHTPLPPQACAVADPLAQTCYHDLSYCLLRGLTHPPRRRQAITLEAALGARSADLASSTAQVAIGLVGDATIALVRIDGILTKGYWFGACSPDLTWQVREAAANAHIDAILLVVDSPGGTVEGTPALADAVWEANEAKPTWAFIEDTCCSAAYWVASQADRIYANAPTALVGSIGTCMGLYDESENYAAHGIRTVVISTGKYKGAGFPGAKITDEHEADWQDLVDRIQLSFDTAVASGRGLKDRQMRALQRSNSIGHHACTVLCTEMLDSGGSLR